MDVGSSQGRGLVVSAEAEKSDVVADDVLVGVDAEVEVTLGTLQAASVLVLTVDNLVGGCNDVVSRGEGEGRPGLLLVALEESLALLSGLDRRGQAKGGAEGK